MHPIRQSTDDRVPGCMYSIPGLPGTKFFAHQVRAIWFIVRRWVWDADIPGALVAEEISLRKTFPSVAAAMLCKLVTQKVVMGLPLFILWGNTLEEWRCTWRLRLSELGDALGGCDHASFEMQSESVTERVWGYTWRP